MGGYATKEAGTTPVIQQDIPKVIELISRFSSVDVEDLHPLGSTGKAPWSSDVDLAVDRNVYDPEMVKQSMSLAGPYILDFKDMSGLGVQSYAIDVDGQAVQVDLMFVDNLEWAKFAYWSPAAIESNYKGAVRTMLLMGVAAMILQPTIDHFTYDADGQLIVRVGRTLDLNKGLRRIFQYRPIRKSGTGFVKTMKTTTLADLKTQFPYLKSQVVDGEITINDPRLALQLMFGCPVDPREVQDAEGVIQTIRRRFVAGRRELIFKKTAERAKSVADKMKLPREITQYL